jgi:hypothetical protein
MGARGKELYAVYADGFGHSRLTNALIERKLGAPPVATGTPRSDWRPPSKGERETASRDEARWVVPH